MTGDTGAPKVLLSPAHYLLDDRSQESELIWVFHILRGLVSSGKFDLDVITGRADTPPFEGNRCTIHSIDRHARNTVNVLHALYFSLAKTALSRRLGRKAGFRIVHHMLPFWMDVTFDLDFLLRRPGTAYVLGPVQSPQQFEYRDTAVEKAEGFAVRLLGRALRALSVGTLKRADRVIVISGHTARMLADRGVDPQRIVLIPPGIDAGEFKYVPPDGKSTDALELVTVGKLIARKEVDLVIQALARVAGAHPAARLRIIGEGPERNALERLASELGVGDRVVFEGPVPHSEVGSFYEKAHAYVSTSASESWGQVYLEAMACGLPVVSARNVGSEEIVTDGKTGFLVERGDHLSLAEKLGNLLGDRELLTRMGRAAREKVEREYDWETVIVPRYVELYESLL